jgi:hypothetical protein
LWRGTALPLGGAGWGWGTQQRRREVTSASAGLQSRGLGKLAL